MRGYCSIFLLSFLFVSIAILSGYKSESSSSGCNSPPEIVVSKPSENDNIENPPVSVEFTAIQNSTDLTSIDLSKVTAIIRDNMNKTIDISQYITNNCDFLKKNCSFKGDVNLSEGEYILEVRVCNTASMCDTKQVSFTVFPIKPDELGDIIINWFKRFRCDYSLWANITNSGCNSTDDPDKDCIRNISGCDNCPDVENPDQADWNKDGIGDACQDSDGDGLTDEEEIKKYKTSPSKRDTDGDYVWDGDEVKWGTSPLKKDTNGNGVDDCKDLGGELKTLNMIVLPILSEEFRCIVTDPPYNDNGVLKAVENDYLLYSYFVIIDFKINADREYSNPDVCKPKKISHTTIGKMYSGILIDTVTYSSTKYLSYPLFTKTDSESQYSWNVEFRGNISYKSGNNCDYSQPEQTKSELYSNTVNGNKLILKEDLKAEKKASFWIVIDSSKEIFKVGKNSYNSPLGFGIEVPDIEISYSNLMSAEKFYIYKEYEYCSEQGEYKDKFTYKVEIYFMPYKIKEPIGRQWEFSERNFLYPSGGIPDINNDYVVSPNYEIEKTGESRIDNMIGKDNVWEYRPFAPKQNSPVKIEWLSGYKEVTSYYCVDYYTVSLGWYQLPYRYGTGDENSIKVSGLPARWINPNPPQYYDESIGRKIIIPKLCGDLGSSGYKALLIGTSPFVITTYFPIKGDGIDNLSWNHQEFPGGEEDMPNFYYYWRNTKADCDKGKHKYVAGCSGEGGIVFGYYNHGENIFYFCSGAYGKNDFTGHIGIDTFAETCIHEKFHKDKWLEWWPSRYDDTKDRDEDWIPDLYEDDLGTNPFLRCSCDEGLCRRLRDQGGEDYATDFECLAWQAEKRWKACSAIEEDYSDIKFNNEYTYCK